MKNKIDMAMVARIAPSPTEQEIFIQEPRGLPTLIGQHQDQPMVDSFLEQMIPTQIDQMIYIQRI